VTSDKLNRFTTAGARLPAGKTSGITARDDGRFQRGDRVALERTGDPYTRLRPGDEGTVTRYDPGPGQLDVRWDSGSTLSMLLHDGDRVRLTAPVPGGAGKEQGR
jgi:uncharacterized protein DUF4314